MKISQRVVGAPVTDTPLRRIKAFPDKSSGHKAPNFLCFVGRASLYNLVNKTNLVYNFS